MPQTIEHYRDQITAKANQLIVNQMVGELAALAVERDSFKARIAELEAQLSPKPEPVSPPA